MEARTRRTMHPWLRTWRRVQLAPTPSMTKGGRRYMPQARTCTSHTTPGLQRRFPTWRAYRERHWTPTVLYPPARSRRRVTALGSSRRTPIPSLEMAVPMRAGTAALDRRAARFLRTRITRRRVSTMPADELYGTPNLMWNVSRHMRSFDQASVWSSGRRGQMFGDCSSPCRNASMNPIEYPKS